MSNIVEKVVETKICEQTGKEFYITDKDMEFYDKISPVFNGQKYLIPTPRLCPEARQQRRLSIRNFHKLYSRTCDATGKNIISMYSSDKNFPVYHQDIWWGDTWNPLDYQQEFDFGRGFFEQFAELSKVVPQMSLMNSNSLDCDYSNFGNQSKGCYLVAGNIHNENCMYGHIVWRSNNCVDCVYTYKSELCYQCVDCFDSYKVFFSKDINYCSESYFLLNCENCEYCFGCVGMRGKKYHIFNEAYSKKEYYEKISDLFALGNGMKEVVGKKMKEISQGEKFLFFHGSGAQNCSGDYLYDSTGVEKSFDIKHSENVKYSATLGDFIDCYDCNYSPGNAEISYEGVFLKGYNILFGHNNIDCTHVYYSHNCFHSSYLFGCIGLRNKQYCILNKQYTKEEYEALVPKIIKKMQEDGEWGEFFPASISPFGYNETVANEYYPLEKEEALRQGFTWSDYEAPFPKVEKIIPANKLPDNIEGIPDDILNWAIECEVTKKPFRIIQQELEFYRKHNLPIPRRHPDQRHLDRMKLRNPRKLFTRKCDNCGVEMQTTYAPDRPETVYCEDCYEKEVY